MKTQLHLSTTKAEHGVSNAIAFILAITIALALGCLVAFVK
ncbi:MAG TPA: hypothetical protein VMT76_08590 [Puia sp.]|nr:hypothetical protein [Puia sp.]